MNGTIKALIYFKKSLRTKPQSSEKESQSANLEKGQPQSVIEL